MSAQLSFRNKRQKNGFILHRDLIQAPYRLNRAIISKNIIFGHDGTIYLIDFERPIRTRTFFLSDIVDITFSFEDRSLDWK